MESHLAYSGWWRVGGLMPVVVDDDGLPWLEGQRLRGLGLDSTVLATRTFSEEDLERLQKEVDKALQNPTFLNIIHDSVMMEVGRPREPVTAERTVTTLLKKPMLAWDVLQGLRDSCLLGPWEEGVCWNKGDEGDEGDEWLETWHRSFPGGAGAVVIFRTATGWHTLKCFTPDRQGEVFPGNRFLVQAGTPVAEVLKQVDAHLEAAGFILV